MSQVLLKGGRVIDPAQKIDATIDVLVDKGVIAAIGHFMIVQAHRLATASHLAPFGYTEIVSAIVIGLIVFGDIPTPIVWLGIALIVASGVAAMRLKR